MLRLQRLNQVHGEVVGALETGRGVAQAVVGGDQPVRAARRIRHALAERELRLEGRLQRVTLRRELGDGLLEERPRARLPRLPVRPHQVRGHRGRAGRVGQRYERPRVGLDPDLADRAHALDRLEMVEHVHRHHRDRVPDPAGHPGLQARDVRSLAADDPAVVGVQEPDQRDLPGPGPLHHSVGHCEPRLSPRSNSRLIYIAHDLRVARRAPARLPLPGFPRPRPRPASRPQGTRTPRWDHRCRQGVHDGATVVVRCHARAAVRPARAGRRGRLAGGGRLPRPVQSKSTEL